MYYKVAMSQKYQEIENFQYFMKCIQNGNVPEILGDRKFPILYEMYYKMAMSQKYWEIEIL